MSAHIIEGKKISEEIRGELIQEVTALKEKTLFPV